MSSMPCSAAGMNSNTVMQTIWGGSQTAPSPGVAPGWGDLNSLCSISPMATGFLFSSRKGSSAEMGCDTSAEGDVSREAKGAAEEHDAAELQVCELLMRQTSQLRFIFSFSYQHRYPDSLKTYST